MSSPDGSALRPLRRHLVKRFSATPASDRRYGLAEGPVWDAVRGRLLWVDINAGAVHTGMLVAGRVTEDGARHLDETVGAVVIARDGELLVAGARVLYRVSPEGVVSAGPRVLAEQTASRLNDAGCDPAGRLLVGSMALDGGAAHEVLVRVEDDGRITELDSDLGLSNGIAFSPLGDRLYSVDTLAGVVWVRGYGAARGAVGRRRLFLHIAGCLPDGLCADEHGNLWIAMWGAGEVRCYSSSGEQLAAVDVAAPNTSSVAFVGADLETLLITTASEQLSAAQLERFPDSGRLFTVDVGVRGLPVPPWAGTHATVPPAAT